MSGKIEGNWKTFDSNWACVTYCHVIFSCRDNNEESKWLSSIPFLGFKSPSHMVPAIVGKHFCIQLLLLLTSANTLLKAFCRIALISRFIQTLSDLSVNWIYCFLLKRKSSMPSSSQLGERQIYRRLREYVSWYKSGDWCLSVSTSFDRRKLKGNSQSSSSSSQKSFPLKKTVIRTSLNSLWIGDLLQWRISE